MSKEKKSSRKPTRIEALICIIFMLIALAVGNGVMGYDLNIMLVVCTAFNMFMAWRCGITWNEMQDGIVKKITSMAPCMLILLGIGFVVGTMMLSGTIPLLVSWLARLINPKYCIVLSFVLLAIEAEAVGSSFAAMGTLGVVMMSVASVQGLPLGIAAAAIISGANYGQYFSPVADVLNCVATANDMTPYEFMKDMARPIGITTVITIIFYFVCGLKGNVGGAGAMENVNLFIQEVQNNFNTNPIVILPLVLAIVLCVLKVPTAIVLFGSGFIAIIMGCVFQGNDLTASLSAAYNGYSTDVFLPGVEVSDILKTLVNRGGMFSLANSIVFLICIVACVGLFDVMGVFGAIQDILFKNVKSIGSVTLRANVAMILFTMCAADIYPPLLVSKDLLAKPFVEQGYNPKRAAIIAMACGQLCSYFLPWSFLAVYAANLFGVTIGEYVKYAIFFPLLPIVIIVLSYLGIGNQKLPENYTAEE